MSWSSGSRYPGRVAAEGRVGRRLIERLDDVEARLWTRKQACLDFLSLPQDQHLCCVPATPGVLTAPGMDGGPLAHGRTISLRWGVGESSPPSARFSAGTVPRPPPQGTQGPQSIPLGWRPPLPEAGARGAEVHLTWPTCSSPALHPSVNKRQIK